MKKVLSVIIFSAIIVAIVAITVFSNGNSPQQPAQTSNSTAAQNMSNLSSISANSTVNLQQLAEHDSKSDCWISYNKSVYDITSWLPRHPGSSAAIEPYCGTAAEFEAAFSGQHGTSNVKKLIAEGEYKGELK